MDAREREALSMRDDAIKNGSIIQPVCITIIMSNKMNSTYHTLQRHLWSNVRDSHRMLQVELVKRVDCPDIIEFPTWKARVM